MLWILRRAPGTAGRGSAVHNRRVEGFRREERNRWVLFDMSQDNAMECASVGCAVPLAQVFDGMEPAA
jgi:hypothetical protein